MRARLIAGKVGVQVVLRELRLHSLFGRIVRLVDRDEHVRQRHLSELHSTVVRPPAASAHSARIRITRLARGTGADIHDPNAQTVAAAVRGLAV